MDKRYAPWWGQSLWAGGLPRVKDAYSWPLGGTLQYLGCASMSSNIFPRSLNVEVTPSKDNGLADRMWSMGSDLPTPTFPIRDGSHLIEAVVRFRTPEEGGRKSPASGIPGGYRPHIISSGKDLRHGVIVTDGPKILRLGEHISIEMLLMWYPEDLYADFQPGSAFTIWEGPYLVGDGTINRRWEFTSATQD